MTRLKIFIAILAVMLASGCASFKTTGSRVEQSPMRTVSVFVLYDATFNKDKIDTLIKDTSEWWFEQFGILLTPVGYATMPDHARVNDEKTYVDYLNEAFKVIGDRPYDIAILFYQKAIHEHILTNLIAGWHGVTDDCYRRYITVTSYDQWVLTHELAHVFAVNHTHDFIGVLGSIPLQLPFVPLYVRTSHVSDSLRTDIMAGKWRDFSKQVDIDDSCKDWK